MIEHERSYVFTHEGAHEFLKKHGLSFYYTESDPYPSVEHISDYYIGKGMRVRKSWAEPEATPPNVSIVYKGGRGPEDHSSYKFTQKTGDKSKGYRFEFEEEISKNMGESLMSSASFSVKKTRKKLSIGDGGSYSVTMDMVESPMKLAILEIEALDEVVYPIPSSIADKLFGVSLVECPLCSYDLFNRRIGIAGGPSSGKSETGKILSHILNTQYGANSFHVAEFATTFIQKYRKNPNFWQEFFIWHGQHEREENAGLANIVISDCPTFLAYIYLLHLPKDTFSTDTAIVLAKMYKRILFDIQTYTDLMFLELQKYKENQVRYQSFDEARQIEGRVKGFLDDHNILYSTWNYTQVEAIIKKLFFIN